MVSTKNTMKDEKYSEDLEKRSDQKGKSTCIPGKESKTNCISNKGNQKQFMIQEHNTYRESKQSSQRTPSVQPFTWLNDPLLGEQHRKKEERPSHFTCNINNFLDPSIILP